MCSKIATTQWSQVLAARDGSDTEAHRALESLCQTYWQPLYAYIRHQGYDAEEARDLTQAYFTVFLEKDYLADVDPEKGRFRSFLLTSLRHFLSHERIRSRALKRGGGTLTLSLDTDVANERYLQEPATGRSPEDVFERQWALTVLGEALGRLRQEASTEDRRRKFELLKPYLTGEEPSRPYREVVEELGMTEMAVRKAVHRLRRRFGQVLRDEVAETVADEEVIDDEVRHLLKAVHFWDER
ncbi:MAG: sigma-70 family RNA polymerase sigma factor [Acidobacteriota bacterium]|jgi:RNA polymerase sigma factor (sigma-70 family)